MTVLQYKLLAQFDILERICVRGRTLFLDKQDSIGVDMFEHIETEIGRLKYMIGDIDDGSPIQA